MTITTQVKFARSLTAEERPIRDAKIAELVSAGATDGTFINSTDDPNTKTSSRIWTTEEAANEWIAFINTFSPPPVIALVLTV